MGSKNSGWCVVGDQMGGDAIELLYDGSSNNGYALFQSWNNVTDGGIQYVFIIDIICTFG